MIEGIKAKIIGTEKEIFVYEAELNGKVFFRNLFKPSETYFKNEIEL